MPAAWQTRGVSAVHGPASQYDAPVRTMIDIAKDPFRWMMSTPVHKAATAVLACALVLKLIF